MKKTIFITGTSSGIGKASVELFAKQGWNVIATVKSNYIETNLFKNLSNVAVYELDVTNFEQVNAVAEMVSRPKIGLHKKV
jgi:NAD(P)-dependent dehydrogenase (short-subunit alcohol dehydrogenase family)